MNSGRITVLFPINHLGTGGAEQQLMELVRGMDKRMFEPIVVTLYPGGALEPEMQATPGVELICLNRSGRFDFSVFRAIARILREKEVDIIQPFLTPAVFFGIVPALANRRVIKIVTERCGIRVRPRLGSSLYRKAEDMLSRYADWIVPNSQAGRDYVVQRGIDPRKVRVIYNGINFDRLRPDPDQVDRVRREMKVPAGGKVVGITASLTPAKDHVTFLKAARIIARTMPDTRFAVLGDGTLRPDLEKMADELGIASLVTFFGIRRDIGNYLGAYDVSCLASCDHEGCSNATLEAMAMAKPVVVTDIGGNREVVQHGQNGLLVPTRDPEAMARGIINVLQNPGMMSRLGKQGRATVLTKFSIEKMVRDYEDLYLEALGRKEAVPEYYQPNSNRTSVPILPV